MGAGLARRRTPTPPPSSGFRHKRRPTAGSAVPPSSFSSHIYLYIYTYIYIKGFIPHPPRSIPSKPLLRGAYVAAHPLQAHPNHTF
ncbi:hypothetical protein HanXRQr2_Chr07g0301791 [Helianthus annuus]|uniref:Uncharacterized protein n=1 Tax=Helianthus annuus TaxID=4232 RepID=A0A9K3ILL3_HELAN|nr:hypothetical protein HanXRQr2_Chr07g0301791 [Helianthus annuus]